MKHPYITGFVWFWGLWAAGSTLDYFGVMPTWPLFLAGVVAAAYFVAPRPRPRREVNSQASAAEHFHTA
jgi:hypothetical protein